MRFFNSLRAMIDRKIDAAVARVITRDKAMLAEQVAESYRHMIDPAAVADQLDPLAVAKGVAVDEVARYVDEDSIAELLAEKVDVDAAEIARNVARNLDMDAIVSHVADEIDMEQVCEACAERLHINDDDVIERAAELVRENIDESDVAEKVADKIDWEADVLDYEQLAKALLAAFAAKC